MLGEWIRDYSACAEWLRKDENANDISLAGYQDASVAALLAGALFGNVRTVMMEDMPPSLDWSRTAADEKKRTPTLALCVTDILLYGDIPDFISLAEDAGIQLISVAQEHTQTTP